jgi:hypothetical protein
MAETSTVSQAANAAMAGRQPEGSLSMKISMPICRARPIAVAAPRKIIVDISPLATSSDQSSGACSA